MLDVTEILTILTKDLERYKGERRKTVLLLYTIFCKLSISTIELTELENLLNNVNVDFNTKKDAIKMVRVINNMLNTNKEEQLANEIYLKEIRNKRKHLTEVIKTKHI